MDEMGRTYSKNGKYCECIQNLSRETFSYETNQNNHTSGVKY